MIEKPIAFMICRKPFNYTEPPLGRVIGSLALHWIKPLCYDPPGYLRDVVLIIDVSLTDHLLLCPKALSRREDKAMTCYRCEECGQRWPYDDTSVCGILDHEHTTGHHVHILTLPGEPSWSNPHEGQGIDTGPSQQ